MKIGAINLILIAILNSNQDQNRYHKLILFATFEVKNQRVKGLEFQGSSPGKEKEN